MKRYVHTGAKRTCRQCQRPVDVVIDESEPKDDQIQGGRLQRLALHLGGAGFCKRSLEPIEARP